MSGKLLGWSLMVYVSVVIPLHMTFCLQSVQRAYLEFSSSKKKDQMHDFLLALPIANCIVTYLPYTFPYTFEYWVYSNYCPGRGS